MSFGYSREPRVFLNNTKLLEAYLYDRDEENLVPFANIQDVKFTVVRPDETTPILDGVDGQVSQTQDGFGFYNVADTINTVTGTYRAFALFTYTEDGVTKKTSVNVSYDVADPVQAQETGPATEALRMAWARLEDCFDSELGGPWLRDMTMARFDPGKLAIFLPDVILDFNSWPPQDNYTVESFPYNQPDNDMLAAQGVLVHTIRHLMRSYVEQPDIVNSQAAFMDRKSYLERWSAIYTMENDRYRELINLVKLRGFGQTSILTSSKAGRQIPGTMRTRNIGRGWY